MKNTSKEFVLIWTLGVVFLVMARIVQITVTDWLFIPFGIGTFLFGVLVGSEREE